MQEFEMKRLLEALSTSGPFTDYPKDQETLGPVVRWLKNEPDRLWANLRVLLNLVHDAGILRGQAMTAYHLNQAMEKIQHRIDQRAEILTTSDEIQPKY